MKKRKTKTTHLLKIKLLFFAVIFMFTNCEKENELSNSQSIFTTVSTEEATSFFENIKKRKKENPNSRLLEVSYDLNLLTKDPLVNSNELITVIPAKTRLKKLNSRILLLKKYGEVNAVVFHMESTSDLKTESFTGNIIITDIDGKFLTAYKVLNDYIIKKYIKRDTNSQLQSKNDPNDCDEGVTEGIFCDQGPLDEVIITATVTEGFNVTYIYFADIHQDFDENEETWIFNSNGGGGSSGGGDNDEDDEDDKIFNELTGKEKCVYEKLKSLKLFKSTINKFEKSSKYNLILKSWTKDACNSSFDDGCTDASDLKNGNITIYIQNPGRGSLDTAAIILHEGIHAEIFKYVDEYKKGLDPNNRKNLLEWYFTYKAQNDNTLATSDAQHQHMADKFVKPIAEALRELDNNKYPLNDYMGFAWEGLRTYGYDGYKDNGKWVTLDKNQYIGNINKVLNNTDFNKDCN